MSFTCTKLVKTSKYLATENFVLTLEFAQILKLICLQKLAWHKKKIVNSFKFLQQCCPAKKLEIRL